jgi:hypothetical protein
MDINGKDDMKQMPKKEDAKAAADEEEQASPSPKIQDRRSSKHDNEAEKMKKFFTVLTVNTQKQHALEIAAMKQTSMETQNLLTTKTMPTHPVNNHGASAHFTMMTKACDVLFDGQPEKLAHFRESLNERG